MNVWELPTSLVIWGVGYPIRSDFRAILDILQVMSSDEYEEDEKKMIFFTIFFEDYTQIPAEHYEEAGKKAVEFIDMGMGEEKQKKPQTMDWAKDAPIIIPAVNKVMGAEIRSMPYLHWWTFLGAYMEIGESLFSSVLNIRQKKAKGKKLEKYEQEFYKENRNLVDLATRERRSEEEMDALRKLFGLSK